jgi:VanZ family protein
MLKYAIRYKFSILVAALISLLSLVPSSSIPDTRLFDISFLDKIVHMGMYGTFAFTALLETRCRSSCLRSHVLLLLAIFFMSVAIEILQATCIASRSAEWLDLLANFLGLLAGYLGYRIIRVIIS